VNAFLTRTKVTWRKILVTVARAILSVGRYGDNRGFPSVERRINAWIKLYYLWVVLKGVKLGSSTPEHSCATFERYYISLHLESTCLKILSPCFSLYYVPSQSTKSNFLSSRSRPWHRTSPHRITKICNSKSSSLPPHLQWVHHLPRPLTGSSGVIPAPAAALSQASGEHTTVANHRARRITWRLRAINTGKHWLAGPSLLAAAKMLAWRLAEVRYDVREGIVYMLPYI